jgi:5-methylcytosine-specific restriction endonuclease McrA
MPTGSLLATVPDDELLQRLAALLNQSRRAEADLVAHIGEVDRRRLYAREAAPSMFAYCTRVLHLSGAEAYLRITAARAARRHPLLLAMLEDGRIHLSAIAKLSPHLTPQNRDAVLRRATHRSKREIEELVAEIAPRPDAPSLVRKLPERGVFMPEPTLPCSLIQEEGIEAAAERSANGVVELRPDAVADPPSAQAPSAQPQQQDHASARGVVEALAPSRYKVQFTASAELCDKLERLQGLLRGEIPDADLGAVIDRAVTQTLERLEARRYAQTRAPRSAAAVVAARGSTRTTRHIPAAVRRKVFERDEGRCRYRDDTGRRCPERHELEYHHLHPFAMGGGHTLDNVRLMCRTHNLYLAEHDYGRQAVATYRKRIGEVGATAEGGPG